MTIRSRSTDRTGLKTEAYEAGLGDPLMSRRLNFELMKRWGHFLPLPPLKKHQKECLTSIVWMLLEDGEPPKGALPICAGCIRKIMMEGD